MHTYRDYVAESYSIGLFVSLCQEEKDTKKLEPICTRVTCLDFFSDVIYAVKKETDICKYGFGFSGTAYPDLLKTDLYFVLEPDKTVPSISEEYLEHINTVLRRVHYRLFGKYRPAPVIKLSTISVPAEVQKAGFTKQYILKVPTAYTATYRLLNLVLKTVRYMFLEPAFSAGWGLRYDSSISHAFLTHSIFACFSLDMLQIYNVLRDLTNPQTRTYVAKKLMEDIAYSNTVDRVHEFAGVYSMAIANSYLEELTNEKNSGVRLLKTGAV